MSERPKPENSRFTDGCSGQRLDHKDGSVSCSRGADALARRCRTTDGWRNCDLHGPCTVCKGPSIIWVPEEDRPSLA